MPAFQIERLVQAPPEAVWPIISDVEGYADIAPNLSRAEIITGEGADMQRRCWDTQGGTWREQCVLWEEGRQYSMQVDTSDYPYPFSKMQGTWGLEPHADGTCITMRFEYQPKYGPIGLLLDWLYIKPTFSRICEQLMDNWQRKIEQQ